MRPLERSLSEFELVQPLVWNRRTGHLVGGHQRLEILRHRGETEIDCVVLDLPLEREKALNVTLNNAAVGGDWDPDRLLDLVSELQQLPDFDATLTGFDEQQLTDMLLTPTDLLDDETSSTTTDDNRPVEAILQVPREEWDGIQPDLDTLLANHPQVRLHIRD